MLVANRVRSGVLMFDVDFRHVFLHQRRSGLDDQALAAGNGNNVADVKLPLKIRAAARKARVKQSHQVLPLSLANPGQRILFGAFQFGKHHQEVVLFAHGKRRGGFHDLPAKAVRRGKPEFARRHQRLGQGLQQPGLFKIRLPRADGRLRSNPFIDQLVIGRGARNARQQDQDRQEQLFFHTFSQTAKSE